MRVLCLSAPLSGHLDWGGYLETARALQRRGHEVLWASGAPVQARVEQSGLTFHALPETGWRWPPPPPLRPDDAGDPQSFQRLRQLRALDQWLDIERVSNAAVALSELVKSFQPDVLISEMFIAAAGIAAERTATPLVVAGWPAPPRAVAHAARPPDPMVATGRERLAKLLARFDIRGLNFSAAGPPALSAPDLHLSYWSPSWFADSPIGPQTRHVGGLPSVAGAMPIGYPDPAVTPWVFITLGTAFNNDPNFFIAASQAAAALGATPIIALGGTEEERLNALLKGRLPGHSQVVSTVDFASVLPYCAAAIHHGGAGTTHALVTYGVPQIVVPLAADQARQGQGVARTGCGYHMSPRQATPDNLRNALAQLLPERSPQREQAKALQAEFAALGGVARATEAVEAITER